MALTRYHSIIGSTTTSTELIAPGDISGTIKSIVISNASSTVSANIKLKLEDTPDSGTPRIFGILNTSIPGGAALIIDDPGILSFDNSKNGFGLYINVGSADAVSVFINI